jgi:acetolactate synthase-1/2/3 large subunit
MNGAESLVRTLVASGIDTCFANPGTSEMTLVAALDQAAGVRCVLGMAETVVTGCADGYARMAEKPAVTLMHCGPGFANGFANLHNARRANSQIVNVVGDHASHHRPLDTPLTTDIEALARLTSHWVRSSATASAAGADAAAAVQAARTAPGQIATLILPMDAGWDEGGAVAAPLPVPPRAPVSQEVLRGVAKALRSKEAAVLVLAGHAVSEAGLVAANRIAHATGAMLRSAPQQARMPRGRGRVPVDRIPFPVDAAMKLLADRRHVILVGAKPPASFFAYRGKPSLMSPADAAVHVLARPEQDAVAALEWLADELGAPRTVPIAAGDIAPQLGRGKFEPEAFARTLAALLPENCIVAEEGITSGRALFAPTFNAAPNDWLQLTGGAIGHAFSCAAGAAIACPDRKVVCLQADGAGMYAPQALWTQVREKLDVVNVVFANRAYRILYNELIGIGAQPGPAAAQLFDLERPGLDWKMLAGSMGMEAAQVDSLEAFADVFRAACVRRGPFLIEFRI